MIPEMIMMVAKWFIQSINQGSCVIIAFLRTMNEWWFFFRTTNNILLCPIIKIKTLLNEWWMYALLSYSSLLLYYDAPNWKTENLLIFSLIVIRNKRPWSILIINFSLRIEKITKQIHSQKDESRSVQY